MYGLINRALERMVVQEHGRPAWEAIRKAAGVEQEVFVTMQSYPDALTYNLVGAASKHLQLPADELLHAFGVYWVRVVAPEGYGPLLELAGSSLPEFLHNLDAMHERVAMAFTNLHQPSFSTEQVGPGHLLVHYRSHRPGLAPFVIGLLHGLAERFETPVEVRLLRGRDDGLDHDVFEVRYE